MNFELINNEDLIEMENITPPPLTSDEKNYIETIERLKTIEKKVEEVLKELCVTTSKIANICTILQHMDGCILMRG